MHTIIIAEAGVNHNGNFDLALKMIDEAKKAGADYVKFQTAKPELVISTFAPKAEYQKETTGTEESQLEMCKAIHLQLAFFRAGGYLSRRDFVEIHVERFEHVDRHQIERRADKADARFVAMLFQREIVG